MKPLAAIIFIIAMSASRVSGADRFWISSDSSNWNTTANWSTASGGSGGATVPGPSDSVFFDGGGTGDCSLDVNISIARINVFAAYSGTITQGTRVIVIGKGGANFSGGIFAGGNNTIIISGNFSINGGTFSSTSGIIELRGNSISLTGGAFSDNNGIVRVRATAINSRTISGPFVFNNLDFLIGGFGAGGEIIFCNIDPAFPITVNGNFSVNGDNIGRIQLNNGTINCYGNISFLYASPDSFSNGTATINIKGGANQILTGGGRAFTPLNIHINKTGGVLTLKGTFAVCGNFIFDPTNAGAFDGTTFSPTLLFFVKSLIGGGSGAFVTGVFQVYNLTLFTGGTFQMTPGTEITVTNTLTLGDPGTFVGDRLTINGGTIFSHGDILMENASIDPGGGGNGTIYINGTGNQILKGSGTVSRGAFPNIIIDKPSGQLVLQGLLYMDEGAKWEYIRGDVDAVTNNTTVAFPQSSIIDGEGSAATMKFNNLMIGFGFGGGHDVTLQGKCIVKNNINIFTNTTRFKLNSNALIIENSASSALAVGSNSGIACETNDEKSIVQWNIGNDSGTYVIPFYTFSNQSIPLVLDIKNRGTEIDSGHFVFTTYRTPSGNTPFPQGVTNLNDTSGNNISLKTVDRFWSIDAVNYSSKPVSDITFQYQDVEVASPNTINEVNLLPYRWTGFEWQLKSPSQVNPAANLVTALNTRDYSAWMMAQLFAPVPGTPVLSVAISAIVLPGTKNCAGETKTYCDAKCDDGSGGSCPNTLCPTCICPSCIRKKFTVKYENSGADFTTETCTLRVKIPVGVKYISHTPCLPVSNIIGNIATNPANAIVLEWYYLCDPAINPDPGCPSIHNGGTSGTIEILTEIACCFTNGDEIKTIATMSLNGAQVSIYEDREISNPPFDPNNKVIDINFCERIERTDTLVYRINFQNIGGSPANNVVVVDTLDIANLDISTLQTGNTSHSASFTLTHGDIATWTFNNINLPDSATDFNGSMGFIDYSIIPVQTITAGTIIRDRAVIFFDFLPPVITNTAQLVIEGQLLSVDAGADHAVYKGYPPLAGATLAAAPNGGLGTTTYLWSTGETTQSITVSPDSTTAYWVIAYDENKCNAFDEVTVEVIDVRCGKNFNKTLICHYPPGNPANFNTLCINASDVPNHLAHGDALGTCPSAKTGSYIPTDLIFETLSDPSSHPIEIIFSVPVSKPVMVEVISITGANPISLYGGIPAQNNIHSISLSELHLTPGIYFCTLKYDAVHYVKKLVVLR